MNPDTIQSLLYLYVYAAIAASIWAASRLEQRLKARLPATRPYRWGFYNGCMGVACGPLAIMASLGMAAAGLNGQWGAFGCRFANSAWLAVSALCGWFIIRRKRWAWVLGTVLSCNILVWIISYEQPRKGDDSVLGCNILIWIINYIYGRNRWGEFIGEAYGSAGTEEEGYELLHDGTKLEAKGRAEEALALYQRIVDRYPHTAAGGDAQKSAESLRARLGLACPAPAEAATMSPLPPPQSSGETDRAAPVVAKGEGAGAPVCGVLGTGDCRSSGTPGPGRRRLRLAVGLTAASAAFLCLASAWHLWHRKPMQAAAKSAVPETFTFEEAQQPPDTLTSEEALKARAEKGDAEAETSLGLCYYVGQGFRQDYEEAAKWFRKAAERGAAHAQYFLGLCYDEGHGVPKDSPKAAYWFTKAANQGNADAQCYLGSCYWTGVGVRQDCAEAAKWYRRAADQGNADAQSLLGGLYARGDGVPQDYVEAVKWGRRAAEQGIVGAQVALAACYEGGTGVPQNDVEAYKWYSLAVAQLPDAPETKLVVRQRDSLSKRMARAEIVEGQRRAAAFVAKKESGGGGLGDISPAPEVGEGKCAGTGFFVTDDGYFVTCEHVVRGASSFHVRSPGGSLPARLIKKDRTIDVAVLKVDGAFRALPVAPQPHVKLGEPVFTIGFPNPVVQGVEPKLTRGEISSMAGVQDNPRYYQISVPVQPGNSGGALLDECGNAVGVVTSRLDDVATYQESGALPQNVNYAVKGNLVRDFLCEVPGLAGKLKAPRSAKDREAASAAAERAAVLVIAE